MVALVWWGAPVIAQESFFGLFACRISALFVPMTLGVILGLYPAGWPLLQSLCTFPEEASFFQLPGWFLSFELCLTRHSGIILTVPV